MNRQGFLGCLNFVFMYQVSNDFKGLSILGGAAFFPYIASSAIQAADQCSKAIVLRRGKFPLPSVDRY